MTPNLVRFILLVAALGCAVIAFRQHTETQRLESELSRLEQRLASSEQLEQDTAQQLERLTRRNKTLRLESESSRLRAVALEEERASTAAASTLATNESTSPAQTQTSEEASARFLASLEPYMNSVSYLSLEDLTAKERTVLGPYADRLTMVRGANDRIGLFGLHSSGSNAKGLSNIPEELDEWVDAYAAVAQHYETEWNRVVDERLARGDAPRFPGKPEAAEFETEARATYFEEHGEAHPGWAYQQVDEGGFVLIELESIRSDPRVAELDRMREQIRSRLIEDESSTTGIMEKWMPSLPDSEESGDS